MRTELAAGIAIVAVMAGAGVGSAQTGSGDRVLHAFAECRATARPDERLACFDKAATALETAVKARDVTIVDRQDVRKARRSLFGFTLPRIDLFGGNGQDRRDKEESFSEIDTTVASARPGASGRVEIRLADESAAVWQATEPMPFPPRSGDRIRIRQGAIGSYFISVGGRSYRGIRLR